MIFKFNDFINEDAEMIKKWSDTGEYEDLICSYTDSDARAFGYLNDEMLVGIHNKEWHSYLYWELPEGEDLDEIDLNDADNFNTIDRRDLEYPGRMWVENKIISFYIYPPKEKMEKVLNDIKEVHDKSIGKKKKIMVDNNGNQDFMVIENKDDKIDWSDGWKIEILDIPADIYWDEDTTYRWDENGNRISNKKPKLILLQDYTGSEERNLEDIIIPHLATPAEKQALKAKGWGKGFGSDKLAPLSWRQAKYVESKQINEDAEIVSYDNNVYCSFTDLDARAFGYLNDEMLVGANEDEWHCYLYYTLLETEKDSEYKPDPENPSDYIPISRSDLKYAGRMWLKRKVISFWEYPSQEEMIKVLKDIKEAHNKIRDQFKKIMCRKETGSGTVKIFKLIKNTDEEINWFDNWKIEIINEDRQSTKLIPLKEYIGSEERNWEDTIRPHLASPAEKQELKKKGWGRGFGSDKSKGLAWKQAKYVENFNNFKI